VLTPEALAPVFGLELEQFVSRSGQRVLGVVW
jgi:hypothetical protein